MTGTECHLCGRPSGDDAYACTRCAETLAAALREITGQHLPHGLAEDLDTAIAKQGTTPQNPGSRRTKASEAPLPMDVRASEAAGVLRNTLSTWVRLIHAEGSKRPLPADTLPAMARWLLPLCGWLRHADYGPEAIDEITAAVTQARKAVDSPPDRVGVGRCPDCSAPVYAPVGRRVAYCRTPDCSGTVDVDAWQDALQDLAWGHEAGATEIADFCQRHLGMRITASTIRSWACRNQLAPTNPGERTPRYKFADVAKLAAEGPAKEEMIAS